MTGCPAYVSDFLNRLVPLVRPMSQRLGIDEDLMLTLSVHEHGWQDAHNDKLHNLFGTTHAGGNNLSYPSDAVAAQSWESHYGGAVRGSKSLTDFLGRLRALGYNSKDPNYDTKMADTLKAVKKFKVACGVRGAPDAPAS